MWTLFVLFECLVVGLSLWCVFICVLGFFTFRYFNPAHRACKRCGNVQFVMEDITGCYWEGSKMPNPCWCRLFEKKMED